MDGRISIDKPKTTDIDALKATGRLTPHGTSTMRRLSAQPQSRTASPIITNDENLEVETVSQAVNVTIEHTSIPEIEPTNDEHIPSNFKRITGFRFFHKTDNSGSILRDQMANERSFLAHLRSSINFLIVAVGLSQMFKRSIIQEIIILLRNDQYGSEYYNNEMHVFKVLIKPISVFFASIGFAMTINGVIRYLVNLNFMFDYDRISADRLAMLIVFLLLIAVSL